MAPVTPVTTTTTAAVAAMDNVIRVSNATDLKPGRILRIQDEELRVEASYVVGDLNVPVLRARGATVLADHPSGATVIVAPYAHLYEGTSFTQAQHSDLCVRLEMLINEYVDVSHKAVAAGKLHDILARLPVDETPEPAADAKPPVKK